MRRLILIGVTFLFIFIWVFAMANASESCSSILKQAFEKWGRVEDYTCTMEAYNRKGDQEDTRVYLYKYMKPGYVYMYVLEGKSRKAKVYYDPHRNMVKGCKKVLFYICLDFKPTDPKVTSIRGATVPESTMGYIIEHVKELISKGLSCAVQDSGDYKVLVLSSSKPFEGGDVTTMKVWMDKALMLPVRWERYAGGQLVNRVVLKDVKINTGLTKEDFKP